MRPHLRLLIVALAARHARATATIVSSTAHIHDIYVATVGTRACAAADGHRVVLVFGTRGACGEVAEGFLTDGEVLGDLRSGEVERSAEALGVARVEFLG